MSFRKKITIAIQKPCGENWNEMTDTQKGKFCASCSKNVIDFSKMKDKEIFAFIKKTQEPICGRFRNDQLGRQIHNKDEFGLPNSASKIAAGIALLTSLQSQAQEIENPDSMSAQVEQLDSLLLNETDSTTQNIDMANVPDTNGTDSVSMQIPFTWNLRESIVIEHTAGPVMIFGDICVMPEINLPVLGQGYFVADTLVTNTELDSTHQFSTEGLEQQKQYVSPQNIPLKQERSDDKKEDTMPHLSKYFLHESDDDSKRKKPTTQ